MNFNRAPYFDDFNANKNFMKVLFRPGRPVQARELNQTQSIQQNQLGLFANHIFKNGTRISNARTSITHKKYVRLENNPALETIRPGTQIVGETSRISATVSKTENRTLNDPATIFFVYRTTAIDGETTGFIPGERLEIIDENGLPRVDLKPQIKCPSCEGSEDSDPIPPIGDSLFFSLDEGVFYFEKMFISTLAQEIVIEKYFLENEAGVKNPQPCKIGLDLVENVVDFLDDESLLDPSLGYPNSTAPGADRYKVDLVLVKRTPDSADGENFILLAKIGDNFTVEYIQTETEYGEIMNMIERRNYETHGNYTVRPFRVSFREYLMTSPTDPRGWIYNGSNETDENLVAVVTPSVAYVHGKRIETASDQPVFFKKARQTRVVDGFTNRFTNRMSIRLDLEKDVVWPNDPADQGLMSRTQIAIYDGPLDVSGDPTGSQIGWVRFNDVKKIEDNVYQYSVYDMQFTTPGKRITDAQSFVNTDFGFAANPVIDADTGFLFVRNAGRTSLLFEAKRDNTKTFRRAANNENGSLSISAREKFSTVIPGSGIVVFNSTSNQFFQPFNNGFIAWRVSGGSVMPIELTSEMVTVGSSEITITLDSAWTGQTFNLICDTLYTNQKEKTKTFVEEVKIENSVVQTLNHQVFLGRADAVRINRIYVTNISDPEFESDVTNDYKLVKNKSATAYRESYIERTRVGTIPPSADLRLNIDFSYLQHSGSQGWFTIDSYKTVFTNPDSGIRYETLENETYEGFEYDLRNTFDFRPIILGSGAIQSKLPVQESTAIFDIEYYLGRIDLLEMTKKGRLKMRPGVASENPRPPRPSEDSMALYEVKLKPYTYSLDDISTKYLENKRYTMRDIGKLETRIKNVEYYTALSLLEKDANSMSIKDINGFDRFKNGFIADDFAQFQAADLTHPEFRAGADRTNRELRPKFKADGVKLIVDEEASTGVRFIGKVATAPFTSEILISNPYATKHISVNPYLQFNTIGKVTLSPNNDTWTDETRLPDVIVDIDSGVEEFRTITKPADVFGTDWGSWVDQNRTILNDRTSQATDNTLSINRPPAIGLNNSSEDISRPRPVGGEIGPVTVRPGVANTVESRVQEYTIEDIVRDVQIIPFIRASNVEFYGSKLKPNTRVYIFFDGENVTHRCRPIGFKLGVDEVPTRLELGSEIYTDEDGNVAGVLSIPGGTFFVGEKLFVISNDPNMTGDPDLETTRAQTTYFAGGLNITRQNSTLNIITPINNPEEEQVSPPPPLPELPAPPPGEPPSVPPEWPPVPRWFTCWEEDGTPRSGAACLCGQGITLLNQDGSMQRCWDPVAQAFKPVESGMVTGLDVFLKDVDPMSDQIWVELRTMANGLPTTSVMARREFTSRELIEQMKFSEDSTVPLHVEFTFPVYVEADVQYCFVVGGYSPNTRIWVSRLGQEVVNIPGKIVEEPPTWQVSFRSLNAETWTPEQFEQIKFNLYFAKFETGTMNIVFKNDSLVKTLLPENPIETQAGSNLVRVYAPNHGLAENDSFSLQLLEDMSVHFITPNPPYPGQVITDSSITATVKEVHSTEVEGEFDIVLEDVSGTVVENKTIPAPSRLVKLRDAMIYTETTGKPAPEILLNATTVTVDGNPVADKYVGGVISGIPVASLNKVHTVFRVDDQDHIVINVSNAASLTGFFGGAEVYATTNIKYDTFNVSGSYLPYTSPYTWSLQGTGYGKNGSPFESLNNQPLEPILIDLGEDHNLGVPQKTLNQINETVIFGGTDSSLKLYGGFNVQSERVAPMINTDTFSVALVSNRVDWVDEDVMNQAPNGAGRFVPEESAIAGTESYKYVTRTVNLLNPASDLHLYFDVYKDVNADFDVYIKTLSVFDSEEMDQVAWRKVENIEKRNSSDLDDRTEYEMIASEQIADWDEDEAFISFKVKIVGRSRNSAKPPLFRSFRGIAVT